MILAVVAPFGIAPNPAAARVIAVNPLSGLGGIAAVTAPSAPTLKMKRLAETSYAPTTRAVVATVPFPITDEKGNPVSATAPIFDPVTNRTYPAGKYWSDVNRIEKALNQYGVSLRDPGDTVVIRRLQRSSTAELRPLFRHAALKVGVTFVKVSMLHLRSLQKNKRIVRQPVDARFNLGKTMHPQAGLHTPAPLVSSTKAPLSIATHTPLPIGTGPIARATATPQYTSTYVEANGQSYTPAPSGSFYPAYCGEDGGGLEAGDSPQNGGRGIKALGCPPISPLPPAISAASGSPLAQPISFSANPSFGDASSAEFYLNASASISLGDVGSSEPVSEQGIVTQGAYLLGNGLDMISAEANLSGDTGTFDLKVLGQTVYSKSGQLEISDGVDFNENFLKFDVEIPVILDISVDLAASIDGDAGLDLFVELTSTGPKFGAGPHGALTGTFTASVGVDLGIASLSVGAYGDILIAQFAVSLNAYAGLSVTQFTNGPSAAAPVVGCQLGFATKLEANDSYTLLNGQYGVYGKVCVWFFGEHCHTHRVELGNFNATSGADTLFDVESPSATFGPIYTDLPQYGFPLPDGFKYSPDDGSGMPAACNAMATKIGSQSTTNL